MTRFCILLIAYSFAIPLAAQKAEIGGGLGPTFYKGDLQPRFNALNPGLAGNFFLRYNLNKTISFKAAAMYGVVKGDDAKSGDPYQKQRDFSFRNKLFDYNLQVEYNFLNFRTHDGRYEHDWTPYLFGGIGFTSIQSKVLKVGNISKEEKSNSGGNMIFPFGIGVKKMLGPRLNISAEFTTKIFQNRRNASMFDSLDGKQEQLSSPYAFGIDPTDPHIDFYQIPNTMLKDKYFQFSVTISYLIYKLNCNEKQSFF